MGVGNDGWWSGAKLRSNITLEEYTIDFSVMHLVEHNIYGGAATGDAVMARMLRS
jgi:hypothetical protein